MTWGRIELHPEVVGWLQEFPDDDFGHAAFYIDLLADQGALLGEPYTRQLRGKLRELRFHFGREDRRISYFIAPGRRIVLLTVFRKTKPRETAQIDRAEAAMKRCVAERHTAE
jgi:hypothetical protein